MHTELSASMMCANYGNLEKEIRSLEEGGIDSFHIDIMDGQFVPNFCMGIQDLKCIRRLTKKPVEVHLMIKRPLSYLKVFIECGVDVIYVHPEADYHPATTLQAIINAGIVPGIAVNPGTSFETVSELLFLAKRVLVMSVNPGFGGQSFIRHSIEKISRLKKLLNDCGSKALIEVDGGINAATGAECAQAGADALVAGSYVFGSPNPAVAIESLRIL